MEIHSLSPLERLRHWREFRSSFADNQSDEHQLIATAQYWYQYPETTHLLDPDDPQNWYTPWEIINEGLVCPVSLPYMMEQTLLMSDLRWIPERLQLMYVDDQDLSAMFMLLVIDAKYVLNYSRNDLNNFDIISKNCIIQNKYSPSNHYRHKII